jgi:hypothetical protein
MLETLDGEWIPPGVARVSNQTFRAKMEEMKSRPLTPAEVAAIIATALLTSPIGALP